MLFVLEILFGQIPEAIYFALFIIFTKRLNNKRLLFIVLNILEYILLFNLLPYSTWSHVLYFVLSYIILKILYKDKCRITDVFTLGIASIILMISSVILYFFTLGFIPVYCIIHRIVLFVFLYCFKDKLYKIDDMYSKLWNRNDKIKKKMKSATFRSINLILFNISFYIINLFLIICSIYWR